MKTEREMFQEHYKTNRDYKFYVKREMTEKQIFDFNNGKYSVDCVNDGWKMWCASASREGYKLVPVEKLEELKRDADRMISSAHLYQDECHIKSFGRSFLHNYKAMTGAVE